MFDKWKITTVVLASIIAYDAKATLKNRKIFKKNLKENKLLRTRLLVSDAQVLYLIHILNENGIAASDFDLIALNNPIVPE